MTDNAISARRQRRYTPVDDLNPQGGGTNPHAIWERLHSEDVSEAEWELLERRFKSQTRGLTSTIPTDGRDTRSQWLKDLHDFQGNRSAPPRLPAGVGYTPPGLPSLESILMKSWRESPSDSNAERIESVARAAGIRPPWERVPRIPKGY
jgi:hypothetical protein